MFRELVPFAGYEIFKSALKWKFFTRISCKIRFNLTEESGLFEKFELQPVYVTVVRARNE